MSLAEQASSPDTVLVVDDTKSKRYLLANWLRRGGFTVIEASTGAEALSLVAGGGIDLVVLDVRLPDMTGFEVCAQIKNHHGNDGIPVVHVSAAAVDAVDRAQGLQSGADAYLVEPIDPDELLATAGSILRYYKARSQAERLASRMTGLTRLGLQLAAATTQPAVLLEAAAGGAAIFRSRIAIVATGDDGARLLATCGGPDERGVLRESTAPMRDEPVGITIRDESSARWRRAGWPDGIALRVLVLRPRADRPPLYVAVPTAATMPGNPVLMLFGQQLASALDTTRIYAQEHHLALTLQRSLLPQALPAVPGYELAARYLPASQTAEIGGDFYEAVRLDGTLMVAVGDVGGHSLHAATIMAEVRHATRAYLAEGHPPAGVLDRVNSLMCRLIPGETATMCLAAIDLADGRVRLANAGHPPPVLRTRAGVRLVTGASPLLGLKTRPPTETALTLDPGDLLVLYTDGLIETRTESIDVNLARLAGAVTDAEPDLEVFASRLLRDVGPQTASDDIAMVAVRRTPVAAEGSRPVESDAGGERAMADPRPASGRGTAVEFAVDIGRLADARQAVERFARGHGLAGERLNDLVLAANELAINAVRHGGGRGTLRMWYEDGTLWCEVRDNGPGMPDEIVRRYPSPDPPSHTALEGRGLWLVHQMAATTLIDTGPQGTTVTIAARH